MIELYENCPECGTNRWKITPQSESVAVCDNCHYATDDEIIQCPDCESYRTAIGSKGTLHCFNCGSVNDVFVMKHNKDDYDSYIIT